MAETVLVGGSIVDMSGVARGKYVPAARLDAFHKVGMGASPSWSVFCVDGSIAFTPELGVVGDNRIRIDPANLHTVEDGVGWAPGDLHLQDGGRSPMCGRGVLTRVVEDARSAGLTARVGAELECTLLSADGGHASTGPWAPYGVRTSLERSALLVDLTVAAERAGLGLEQLHTEYGHDQLEVSLSPTDPVSAADDVVLARIVLGRVAARHGLAVSFSPLPFAGEAGNGAHLHLSLADADGRPVLDGGTGPHGLTPAGEAAIAGILDALPGLLGVYAGSALSLRRLVPGNWAGAAVCWGLENREAAVRLVGGGPASAHGANIELKVVDPSANPYLAVAALLGSAVAGVRAGLSPADEVAVHPGESGRELPQLPASQSEAIDALEASAVARDVLGAPVVAGVAAVRRREVEVFGSQPLADTAEALRLAWSC
ncbi:glutamine synthetase family protein [Nocardioides sp. SR21]|uniref:glutamine synthetase family protein n=1 Tax=Nocardioides sp. SR21 TaxID=2919501 RepID=UPI001FA98BE9|nr:glutamine synthetase family protein [Nocardioides sp. SR21]